MAVDSAGNLYFADSTSGRIRKVTGLSAPPAGAPAIFAGGIVNAASFEKLPGVGITPGEIVSIFGSGFATATTVAATIPLPITLAGARVLMNGIPASLFAVAPSQINAVVPWELGNAPS